MTAATDLSRIERSILIAAPRARVWRAITDVREFSAWFRVKAEGEFAPGARVRMTSTDPSYPGIVFYLTVADVIENERFSWTWHPGADQPPEGSSEPTTLVTFRLTDEPHGTRVTVVDRVRPDCAGAPRQAIRGEHEGLGVPTGGARRLSRP